jgi:hypothetical protein
MNLSYASYIFALAMGVGKTVLIGALLASEFALALAHPAGPFLRNALVFAPGRTIVESLRALIDMPYAAVLPPHLHRPFAAAVKFIVPQDGERTIPVLPGSAFNVIITNTEKIRIQKETIRKRQLGRTLSDEQTEAAKAEIANLRLQTISSLPSLGIFSDEAHHTYGRALDRELKKVRKTVDYIATQTNVRVVVNTTGTPYFGRQPLRDVVISYGLAAGIRDGILKEVGDNVVTYGEVAGGEVAGGEVAGGEVAGGEVAKGDVATGEKPQFAIRNSQFTIRNAQFPPRTPPLATILPDILQDFFATYGAVTLPDGTPAKLAIYFPKTADIAAHRPLIERTLLALGQAPTVLLEHHTYCENKSDFDRFRTRQSPHRVALLVDRGVEGWDVPALFACALVRTLKTSNNFVLQAAARCLRQVAGNRIPARIYLSAENQAILARQLRTTYGDTLTAVAAAKPRPRVAHSAPPAVAITTRRTLPTQPWQAPAQLTLHVPATPPQQTTRTQTTLFSPHATAAPTNHVPLLAATAAPRLDHYTAAVMLASCYHLDLWLVYRALQQCYAAGSGVPTTDLAALRRQIEQQCCGAVPATTPTATLEAVLD